MNLVSSISASYELQIRSLFSLKIPKIILYQVINLLRLIYWIQFSSDFWKHNKRTSKILNTLLDQKYSKFIRTYSIHDRYNSPSYCSLTGTHKSPIKL
jgi:hypothetical protein